MGGIRTQHLAYQEEIHVSATMIDQGFERERF